MTNEDKNIDYPPQEDDLKNDNGYTTRTFTNAPILAIVGRPNTGKSTLFNRFMGKRLAIVDPTRGVTRDTKDALCLIQGKPVEIIDTAGFMIKSVGLDKLAVDKSLKAIEKAQVILLLLDSNEITAEDEALIELLRPHWDKVIAAVNKCEGGKNEGAAYNYVKFGFENLYLISASHGDGITELAKAIIKNMDFSHTEERTVVDTPIRVAIIGKPNTGKSTLLNALTGKDLSIVSDIAGTTRDSVEGEFTYKEKKFLITDTAGIRKKTKVKNDIEYYSVNRAIKTLDDCDIAILMINAKEGVTEQDKKISSLAHEKGRGIIFALNKWDLSCEDGDLKGNRPLDSTRAFKKAKENINIIFPQMAYAPIIPLVAKDKKGIKTLLREIIDLYRQLNENFSTNVLNRALKDFVTNHPAPSTAGHHFTTRYITQTGTNPIEFTIFVTKTENVAGSYLSYLENQFRGALGLEKIPIKLILKASRKAWEEHAADKKNN